MLQTVLWFTNGLNVPASGSCIHLLRICICAHIHTRAWLVLFLILVVDTMYSARQNDVPADVKKYDPHANQWMREALDSRLVIEELKAQNDKLQRELYALNSKVSLIQECVSDLNMADRVSDLMQKKIRTFQLAQHARQNPPPAAAAFTSPRQRKSVEPVSADEGFICGSGTFQQTAGFSSSYEGQLNRDTFNRKKVFETEEAQFREKLDIFGNVKAPSPKQGHARRGDAIDSLLSSSNPETIATPGRQPLVAQSSRSYGTR